MYTYIFNLRVIPSPACGPWGQRQAPSEEELFRFMADVDEDGSGHPRSAT